jgi:hypothetical protein
MAASSQPVLDLGIRGKVKQKKDQSARLSSGPFRPCRKCTEKIYGQVSELVENVGFGYLIPRSKIVQKKYEKHLSFQFFY